MKKVERKLDGLSLLLGFLFVVLEGVIIQRTKEVSVAGEFSGKGLVWRPKLAPL